MAANDLDAIIALTNGPAWLTNDDPERRPRRPLRVLRGLVDGGCGVAGSTSRCPPATTRDCPIGITFIGGRWDEPELIGFAYDYEQATQVRVPPQFIPTIGDDLFPGVPNPPERSGSRRPRVSAISSCASGRGSRGDDEARPSAGLRAVGGMVVGKGGG